MKGCSVQCVYKNEMYQVSHKHISINELLSYEEYLFYTDILYRMQDRIQDTGCKTFNSLITLIVTIAYLLALHSQANTQRNDITCRLLGHCTPWHALDSSPKPTQSCPPAFFAGLLHRRFRIWVPTPQLVEHPPHSAQYPQFPSSGLTKKWKQSSASKTLSWRIQSI